MKITKVTDIDKRKIVLDGCMVTYTGIVFDLMNPDPKVKLLHLWSINAVAQHDNPGLRLSKPCAESIAGMPESGLHFA